MIVREAARTEYPDIESFYRSVGEEIILGPTERVAVAHEDNFIVGAARLVKEHGCIVLRTVNVAPAYQKHGIGTELVKKVCEWADTTPLYCLPYPPLREFYENFGFKEVSPETLPSFLSKRLTEYRRSFSVIAMLRTETSL